jgi:alpha-D-ribose 1-methylphosphonate 5-triphosphate synthase subunit PhnG
MRGHACICGIMDMFLKMSGCICGICTSLVAPLQNVRRDTNRKTKTPMKKKTTPKKVNVVGMILPEYRL